ncbi:autotransporter domain-containing protein [Devosia sp.]|uniref:autotransporter domain-containing protein n=1 Tax=Devosia sp. TaxID=1871048 RepID=UPI002FC86C78
MTLGGPYSQGRAVSADGSVMVGISAVQPMSSDFHAFAWTPGGGTVDIGTLGGDFSAANGISGDGSTIVGSAELGSGMSRAFRYRADTGMVNLGTLGGLLFSEAMDVSLDGTVVVGTSSIVGGTRAFRWVEGATGGVASNPQMFDLGVFAGGLVSNANAVSDDGSVVVGFSDGAALGYHAFRWTAADGMVDLGTLAGGGSAESRAYGISGDGNFIVGRSDTVGSDEHAFRWSAAEGMIDLGTLGGADSLARAASLDGSVVVGYAEDATDDPIAFRWTEEAGMRSVAGWLGEAGVDIGAWELFEANGVSDDGTVVVGTGVSEDGDDRAYLARVAAIGSGVIDTAEYTRSLYDATQLAYAGQHLSWLPLTGAHHRPLMDYAGLGGDKCFWANGDFGRYNGVRNTTIGLAEAGFCADLFDDTVRAGIGVGTSFSTQGLPNSGSSSLGGQYLLGEIDWAPEGTPLLLSGTAILGNWRADIRRGYMNGASVDFSQGQTAVNAALVRGRIDWLDAATFGTTTISPWASFTLANTSVDGYTETGGGFPARFDAQSQTASEVRVGLTAETELTQQTTLRTTIEGVHRFDSTGPALTGQTLGLFEFSLPGQAQSQTWTRIGLDLEHEFSSSVLGTLSLQAATAGQDPDFSGAVGLRIAM